MSCSFLPAGADRCLSCDVTQKSKSRGSPIQQKPRVSSLWTRFQFGYKTLEESSQTSSAIFYMLPTLTWNLSSLPNPMLVWGSTYLFTTMTVQLVITLLSLHLPVQYIPVSRGTILSIHAEPWHPPRCHLSSLPAPALVQVLYQLSTDSCKSWLMPSFI